MRPQQLSLAPDPAPAAAVDEFEGLEKRSRSEVLHALFLEQCRQHNLPAPVRELMFAKQAMNRRWQFDFAWPQYRCAVEIEGLVVRRVMIAEMAGTRIASLKPQLVMMGRHASIQGFCEDAIKYGSAEILGWHVIRFAQIQVKQKIAVAMTRELLMSRGYTDP